jgi:hypothetical protein
MDNILVSSLVLRLFRLQHRHIRTIIIPLTILLRTLTPGIRLELAQALELALIILEDAAGVAAGIGAGIEEVGVVDVGSAA